MFLLKEKYAGNQLAVFRGVKALSDAEMQRIAKEMNFSETTFILSDEKAALAFSFDLADAVSTETLVAIPREEALKAVGLR